MGKKSAPSAPGTNGNTNSSLSRYNASKVNECKRWCFTFHGYTEDDINLLQKILQKICSKYVFQEEICPTTKHKHLQGAIWLNKKARYTSFGLPKQIHWEKMRNEIASEAYCQKDETSTGRRWIFPIPPPPINIISELRPFQKSLETIMTGEVDEGKIMWVYDEKGQIGKTDFLRYMYVTHNIPFAYGGKCSDIMNLVFNNKQQFLKTDRGGMIFNFGREMEMDKVSYKSLEQISDGAIYNSKFEAGCFVCNKPHVLVLANSLPLMKKLTESRWKIFTVNEKLELINYVEKENPLDVI